MAYFILYLVGIALLWYVYKVGWLEALKFIVSIFIPSFLIILFNIKAGKLIFKSPVIGVLSTLPTAIFIFQGSKPLVFKINNWIDNKKNGFGNNDDAIDTESIPVDE